MRCCVVRYLSPEVHASGRSHKDGQMLAAPLLHKGRRAAIAVGTIVVILVVIVTVSTAWRIGNRTGPDAERLVAQGQLIIAALQFVVAVALAGITGGYAWLSKRMVEEMRATRELQILPKLTLTPHFVGPGFAETRLVNVGAGPAFDVDVHLQFEASGAGLGRADRRWRAHLVAPGDVHDFGPPERADGSPMGLEDLGRDVALIKLVGTMRDAMGRLHAVDEAIRDVPEWDRLLQESDEMYKEDPLEVLAREARKANATLAKLANAVDLAMSAPADRKGGRRGPAAKNAARPTS